MDVLQHETEYKVLLLGSDVGFAVEFFLVRASSYKAIFTAKHNGLETKEGGSF
jgi:hypothetical protein